MVTIANSTGETAWSFLSPDATEIHGGRVGSRKVDKLGDLLIAPRLATSFDLTETQTLVLGASGAFGPNNSGTSARTRILGLDAYWKWKPAAAQQGFPFLSLQAEGLTRRYDAEPRASLVGDAVLLPGEVLKDKGAYAQVLWGIKPRIVAGLRGDWVKADPALNSGESRTTRSRISPNFTWYPTEFSKFRIQYNYDDRKTIGVDHSLWFQFEFLLGAHAAHRF
jgi:hypothetical protein